MTLREAEFQRRNIDTPDLPDRNYPLEQLSLSSDKPLFSRSEILNLTTFAIAVLSLIGFLVEVGLPTVVNVLVITLAGAPIAVALAYMLWNGVKGRIE